MKEPAISVLLPVYNSALYLSMAIQSVLDQSFGDFELIIINDGSTDYSEQIILSFTDSRIVYFKNKENKGLIFSLNHGIEIAKGKYIARMDADDICLPKRFEKQINFLEENKTISVVASTVNFINEKNEPAGNWELDLKTIQPKEIKCKTPFQNCIAHPSILIRTEIAKANLYDYSQKNIEDYDLWLRLLNKKYSIAKLNEPLLLYRTHPASITKMCIKNANQFFKQFRMKTIFLRTEFFSRRITYFTFLVFCGAIVDLATACFKWAKSSFTKNV